MESYDGVIVGGGLIGMAVARELHRRGLSVAVFDSGEAGRGASWAGAGMLAATQTTDPALRRLGLASAALYPTYVGDLEAETGLDVGYRVGGTVFIEAPGHALAADAAAERLSAGRLAAFEPALRPLLSGESAWYIPGDHSVDNRRLVMALAASLHAREVALREHCAVRLVEAQRGGGFRLATDAGDIGARFVVNAAGAWAGQLAAPAPAAVRPRKGQMLALAGSGCGALVHVVASPGVYLVPRSDGRLLVGATLEDVGFDTEVEPARISELHGRALALAPILRDAPVVASWAGLRPGADGGPLVGSTAVPGYWLATGHFRDGILLTPHTAVAVADSITAWLDAAN